MKSILKLIVACTLLSLVTGCATRITSTGGKETTLLGGAMIISKDSFQPTTPTTIDADTSKIIGSGGPSGKKISLFWGVLTLHDY
jgi:hypothetical protein